ncbi:MAG: hypothetical protein R2939_08725 [Kofleriaceae bacterium]
MWKWSEGLAHATDDRPSAGVAFLLALFCSVIGLAVLQAEINKAVDRALPAPLPTARVV